MQEQLEKKERDLEVNENKLKNHEQIKVQQLYNIKKDNQQVNQINKNQQKDLDKNMKELMKEKEENRKKDGLINKYQKKIGEQDYQLARQKEEIKG